MRSFFPIIVLVLLSLVITGRGQALELTSTKAMAFADHLFQQGDYYRAITEYERVLFFYPDDPLAGTAQYQIANSYLKGEKWAQAAERFRAVAERYSGENIGRKASFMLGETYYLKRDYRLALDGYDAFLRKYPHDPQGEDARIRMGWCYLRLGNWERAAEEFRDLPASSALGEQAGQLAEEASGFPAIPRKSPSLAAGLSTVLPGAGQLYVDRPTDALISLLLNGLFIWGAVEAIDHGNTVAGGIVAALESGWYVGNIYNAASSAHKYNRKKEQDFIDSLQGKFGVSYYRNGEGQDMLALTFHF
jgi:TM2 domain-containing membrane protein YozV